MDYEKEYKEALERARMINNEQRAQPFNIMTRVFSELKESEDERIRKEIIDYLHLVGKGDGDYAQPTIDRWIAWLEKQKVTDKEIIFRPAVGTDIRIAAKQALEKIDIGKKVVLAFNGAYIPVNGKTVVEIDSEYDVWLEKQSNIISKDMKLTYKDIETILGIENNILHECNDKNQLVIEAYPKGEDYYGEILRRFNNQGIKPQRMISAEAKEALYDKPAWSEEDEASTVILNGLCDLAIAEYDEDSTESPMKAQFVKTKNWLKSLKDRMKGG